MRSFLEWLDQDGFYVKQAWSIEDKRWIEGTDNKLELFPHQRRVLEHCFTPREDGTFPYSTVVYSTIKKSGKTTLEAAIGDWWAEENPGSEIYMCANDLEQAQQRSFEDMTHHALRSGHGSPTAKVIRFDNGSVIQVLAQHYTSAAGSRPSLVLYDELWGYISERARRMWAEMTLPPTIPNAMRVIVTYAGFEDESDLLFDIYNKSFVNGAVVEELKDIVDDNDDPVCHKNGRTFVMWDTVPRMPWQTPDYYESEMANLRPSDFLRMHKNRWVTSNESFIPVEMWDKAASKLAGPLTLLKDQPAHTLPITIGVDIGTKHDSSAVVGVYYDSKRNKVGLAFHAIWIPIQGETLDIENTVESYLINIWKVFKLIGVLFDPSQFLRSGVSLRRRGLPMIEFPQTEGNMTLWKWMVYVVAGVLAAISGITLAARLEAADSIVGVGWEFDAIAAAILGGTSFARGKGGIGGTVLGVLVIGVTRNGLNVTGVPSLWQPALTGTIIILAIVFEVILSRWKEGRR
jgi:hypothetical protein